MSALSSGKIEEYEFFTGEKMLLSYQRKIIEVSLVYKLSLHILLEEKLLKKKEKQLKIKE